MREGVIEEMFQVVLLIGFYFFSCVSLININIVKQTVNTYFKEEDE